MLNIKKKVLGKIKSHIFFLKIGKTGWFFLNKERATGRG